MIEVWMAELAAQDGAGLTDAARIDLLCELEKLKGAAAATQARVTARLNGARPSAGDEARRDAAAQVALARRDSPATGARHVEVARALVADLPHTHAALSRGEISEWRAALVVRETAALNSEDRQAVDAELSGHLFAL